MPRLSSPSFKVVVKRKVLGDGSYPVRIQSNWLGQSEVGLGFSIPSLSHFDKARQRVKKSCPNHDLFNTIIEQKLAIVRKDYLTKLESGINVFTAKGLLDCLRAGGIVANDKRLVSSCFEACCRSRSITLGTQRYYGTVKRHVIKCYGDVPMSEIIDGQKYLSYLDGLGVGDATKRINITTFRAVWEYAVENDLIPFSCPFPIKKSVIKRFNRTPRVQFLTDGQLSSLVAYYLGLVLKPEYVSWMFGSWSLTEKKQFNLEDAVALTDEQMVSRSKWGDGERYSIMMYLIMSIFGGLSPVDLGKMKVGDLKKFRDKDGDWSWCCDGNRTKTGTEFHPLCKVNCLSELLFEPFIRTAHLREGYLFNILYEEGIDLSEKYYERSRMNVFSGLVNRHLKKVWKRLNANVGEGGQLIDEDTVFYSARHTFASRFVDKSGNISALCSILGRSPNNIATYVHVLTDKQRLSDEVSKLGL